MLLPVRCTAEALHMPQLKVICVQVDRFRRDFCRIWGLAAGADSAMHAKDDKMEGEQEAEGEGKRADAEEAVQEADQEAGLQVCTSPLGAACCHCLGL